MAKKVDVTKIGGDIDKEFEKISKSMSKKIDNGGTRPKRKTKKKSGK